MKLPENIRKTLQSMADNISAHAETDADRKYRENHPHDLYATHRRAEDSRNISSVAESTKTMKDELCDFRQDFSDFKSAQPHQGFTWYAAIIGTLALIVAVFAFFK